MSIALAAQLARRPQQGGAAASEPQSASRGSHGSCVATSLTRPLRALCVAGVALAFAGAAAAAPPGAFDRVVFLGASLTDSGNAAVWLRTNPNCGVPVNVPPYDLLDDFRIPDGPYASGGLHATNGATWAEGLARQLKLAGNARPAYASDSPRALDYAVLGARAIAGFPCRVNLSDQVSAYLQDVRQQTAPRTLVAIEIGGNDMRDALVSANPSQVVADALNGLAGAIVALYGSGAREFLVLNVPDIGKTPAVRTIDQMLPGTAAAAGQLVAAYNLNLVATVQGLTAMLPGSRLRIVDAAGQLDDVVANPSAYGFVNTAQPCVTPNVPPYTCRKPDTYVFWDGIHPTRAVHRILADLAFARLAAP